MYAVKRNFTFFERLFIWRRMNFSEQKFILMISFVVGILTAFAGLFLKWLIHQIQYLLTYRFDATGSNALYLVYPVIGFFLTGLFVRYVVKDDISHGVTKILFAIARKQSKIKAHNTWSSVIASAITIGFGGSVGAEAPIVLTGSAIGSNLGCQQQDTDAFGGLRSGGCRGRHLQSPDCRACIHPRSPHDRPHDGSFAAFADFMRDGRRSDIRRIGYEHYF